MARGTDDVRDIWGTVTTFIRGRGSTPTIREQVKCPPGQYRQIGGGCVPLPVLPPSLVEIIEPPPPPPPRPPGTGPRPPKDPEARGPLPPIIEPPIVQPPVQPPVVQPPVQPPIIEPPIVQPPASPADALPRQQPPYYPRTTPRIPGTEPTLPRAMALIPGILLGVLYSLVFEPYFRTPLPAPRSAGPPRRRGRVTTPTVPAPRPFWDQTYTPGYRHLPGWMRPIRGPFPLPGGAPDAVVTSTPVPDRPRTLPRTRTPVSTVPAPTPWGLGDPLPGPGYDPFTHAPAPAPAPRARAQPRTRVDPLFRVLLPLPFSLPSLPGGATGFVPRTLTPQPRLTTPRAPRTPTAPAPQPRPPPTLPPPPSLTPFDPIVPTSQPQPQPKPTQSNPCTQERTARRRRQRDCKKYSTKTIRVCAD